MLPDVDLTSIGTASLAADEKSAGGLTALSTARAFVSAPASTLGNIAQPEPAVIANFA